jgi:uncharacterized phage-like protein YoqJ
MIVSFTGHRPKKFGGFKPCPTHERVKARLREKLLELKPTQAISGMALGFDQWAAEICVELEIPFIAAIPYPGQELGWTWPAQQHWEALMTKAARIQLVDLEAPKTYWEAVEKLHARNHWMVENSQAVIAGWDGSDGGTAECIRYAQGRGVMVHRIGQWTV